MKRLFSAAIVGLAVSGAILAAQSPAVKGDEVSFSGCVTAGTHNGSFLLTDIKRTDGAADTNTIYWLDSAKKLDGQAGHRVEVTGVVSKVEGGDITSKTDAKKGTEKVEVKKGGSTVTAQMPSQAVGTTGNDSKTDEAMPLMKIKVQSLKMLSSTCESK
jgi:type 1 fimbria pilin